MIIGIAGFAGSGKDTLAKAICLNHGFASFAFADKLKEIIADLYDLPIEYFHDRVLKNKPHANLNGKSPRKAAQLIGTQGFRDMIDPMTWINYVMRRARETMATGKSVVITDVRFPEELQTIRSFQGSLLIGLEREGSESYAHESEAYIPEIIRQCDVVISNNGSIQDLATKGNEVVAKVKSYTLM